MRVKTTTSDVERRYYTPLERSIWGKGPRESKVDVTYPQVNLPDPKPRARRS